MTATVETILLSATHGRLHFRVRRAPLPDGGHPDALARELAGFHDVDSGRLLHSTSWRYAHGRVVLTYAALPDPDPSDAVPLDLWRPLAYADDPMAPALTQVDDEDVAAHACRHLAYLRRTDPLVALTADVAPQLWDLLAGLSPAVAGLLVQPALSR